MSEVEELRLVAAVEEDFEDELDDLSHGLEEVGLMAEEVFPIEAEVDSESVTQAIGELETLDSAIRDMEDQGAITLDVETNLKDIGPNGELLKEGFTANTGARGSQFIDESTGRFASAKDAVMDFGNATVDVASANIDADAIEGVPSATDGGGGMGASNSDAVPSTAPSMSQTDGDGARWLTAPYAGGSNALKDALGTVFSPDGNSPFGGMGNVELHQEGPLEVNADSDVWGSMMSDSFRPQGMMDDISGMEVTMDQNGPMEVANPADAVGFSAGDLGGNNPMADSRGIMQRFADTITNIDLKMGDFYSILADLVPLMGTFIAAIPAAATALIGLAGAAYAAMGVMAAVGGLGLMGLAMEGGKFKMQNIQKQLSKIGKTFREAFAPIANKMAPLILDAVSEIRGMIRDLAASGDALLALKEQFRGLVQYITGFIPSVARKLTVLTNAAAPIFAAIGEYARNSKLIEYFAQQLAEMLPFLAVVASQIADFLPMLINMSEGFFFAATMVMAFANSFMQMIDMVPFGITLFGALIGTILVTASAAAVLSSIYGALGAAFEYVAGTAIASTITSMEALTFAEIQATLATLSLAQAIGLLIGVATLGIGLVSIVSMFATMNNQITQATSSLKEFGRVSKKMDGTQVGFGMGDSGATAASGGAGKYVEYHESNTYKVNADSREQANRAADTLSYVSSYTNGKDIDSSFAEGSSYR